MTVNQSVNSYVRVNQNRKEKQMHGAVCAKNLKVKGFQMLCLQVSLYLIMKPPHANTD